MRNEVLEAWEFGDPCEVVARREAREVNQQRAKQRLLTHKRRRIRALVKLAMKKARAT